MTNINAFQFFSAAIFLFHKHNLFTENLIYFNNNAETQYRSVYVHSGSVVTIVSNP